MANEDIPVEIERYISKFDQSVREKLLLLRQIILQSAPGAQETIKYAMPTLVLNGNLVHYAAYDHHIGLYPAPSAIKAFEARLENWKWSKGAIQFPLDKPLPEELITDIVVFRRKENMEKAVLKQSKRTCSKGHVFYKTSDCPVCPKCAALAQNDDEVFNGIGAPALRALKSAGINKLDDLTRFTEKELLALHGFGNKALTILLTKLNDAGQSLKEQS